MPRVAELREEIKNTQTLKTITDSLSEVSSMKIVHIRKNFEKNKEFYAEIAQLYETVRAVADIARPFSGKNLPELPKGRQAHATKRPERISAAVTTNQRFYGMINLEVSQKFKEETEKKDVERLMIGRTGAKYLKSLGDESPYKTLEFEHDIPSHSEIHTFLEMVKDYQQVIVYYPKFVSMFTQTPAKVDINYSPTPAKIAPQEIEFIFEPELPKILEFFETHIRYLLFKRVMLDVELAVTASRLLSMSRARDRASEMLKERQRLLAKQKRALINARLLEATVGSLGARKW